MNLPTRVVLLVFWWAIAAPAMAQDRLAVLAGNGGVLLHSPTGEVLASINPARPLVPASLVKIPLAQVALTTLGEDFHFETHFYRNAAGDLLIRGLGDPQLVSEEIMLIVEQLAGRGLRQVRRLVLDDSAFEPSPDLPLEAGADDPYAARNSALAVNFNTVNLDWAADGTLISGEQQTPLTPLARDLGARLSRGEATRINLGEDSRTGLLQVQQLFRHFLAAAGIPVADAEFYRVAVADAPQEWMPFYQHANSRSLPEVLDGLLRYSNNFIANQLFLTLGARQGGYPATVEAARTELAKRLRELYGDGFGTEAQALLMREGSGLGREQRATAAGMMRILESFKPWAGLLPESNGVLRKSGTLTGVYNFAGYIPGPDGLYPYVILTNQSANNRAEILQLLQRRIP